MLHLLQGAQALRGGQWDRAHQIAQDDPSRHGSWLHGIVHMAEPDESNSRYWYRQAGREFPGMGHVEAELARFVDELDAAPESVT